jgi:hypothetical protein
MSRPYFNINESSFSGGTLSVNLTYYKLRDNNKGILGTVSVDGFSGSTILNLSSFNDTPDPWQNANTATFEVDLLTIGNPGIPTLAGSSFVAPTIVYTVTGTPSITTSATVSIGGVNITNYNGTSSLDGFLTSLSNNFNASASQFFPVGTWDMTPDIITATQGSLTITTNNTGNYYNGTNFNISLLQGAGGATIAFARSTNTFSGGSTTYKMQLNYAPLGPVTGGNDQFDITI